MTDNDNWASPGKPVKRFFKAGGQRVWQFYKYTFQWVQAYSEHPDGREPHYSARDLRERKDITARIVRKPTKEDYAQT